MFDVGFLEIMLIGVVSLVVIGPERLPAVAKSVGRWVAKMQRFVRGVKTDLASELESGDLKKLLGDQREQIDELRKIVQTTQSDLQKTAKDVTEGATRSLKELEKTTAELDKPGQADTTGADTDNGDKAIDAAASSSAAPDGNATASASSTASPASGKSADNPAS